MSKRESSEEPYEIPMVGDLTENAAMMTEKLIEAPPGSECILYFDSPGGSPYTALSLMNLILWRELAATGVVTGECSSAALWPFAACRQRLVSPLSVLLFHPMKWQSEENIHVREASEWARHFGQLEKDMDELLAKMLGLSPQQMEEWNRPGRYISGREFAEAGLAELLSSEDSLSGPLNAKP
jgi:ATP-dependent Clp protease protease subunit